MFTRKVASIALVAIIFFLAASPEIFAQGRCRNGYRSGRYYNSGSYYAPSRAYYAPRRSYYAPRRYYEPRRSKTRAVLTIAAPAAIGAGIGALIGGGKGAGVGALLGGGGGALYYLTRNRRNHRRY